jgi:hypothetical protein
VLTLVVGILTLSATNIGAFRDEVAQVSNSAPILITLISLGFALHMAVAGIGIAMEPSVADPWNDESGWRGLIVRKAWGCRLATYGAIAFIVALAVVWLLASAQLPNDLGRQVGAIVAAVLSAGFTLVNGSRAFRSRPLG